MSSSVRYFGLTLGLDTALYNREQVIIGVSSLIFGDLERSFDVTNRLVDSFLILRSKVNLILILYVSSVLSSLFLISALIVNILVMF